LRFFSVRAQPIIARSPGEPPLAAPPLAAPPIVAIDGPAGAGKSTTATAVARRLGWRHVDTGAMYRCVALESHRRGIDPAERSGREEGAHAPCCSSQLVRGPPGHTAREGPPRRLLCAGSHGFRYVLFGGRQRVSHCSEMHEAWRAWSEPMGRLTRCRTLHGCARPAGCARVRLAMRARTHAGDLPMSCAADWQESVIAFERAS